MNNTDIEQLHQVLDSLAQIPTDEFRTLVNSLHPVDIRKKDFFIRAGDIAPEIGFIISGVFKCYYLDHNGTEYTKHFFKENDFMAANSPSFTAQESMYNFEALEDSRILMTHGVERLTHPCWLEVSARQMERVHKCEERRVKQLLLEEAEIRYESFLEDFPGLETRIKQSDIASYIGISPVSLSRIRSKYKNY